MKIPFLFCVLFSLGVSAMAEDRPNILWLTSEDNSPYLGCYGDKLAQTPRLDALAKEGFRYRNAFSSAPVCSAARTTLITGMNASSVGGHNHRSGVRIPSEFRFYPELLKEAGYYTTNNSKTDYNALSDRVVPSKTWDESNGGAHYKNRPAGKPFFAVFNTTTSHEGQTADAVYEGRELKGLFPRERIVAPEDVVLPPYHADTPIVRENWSRYYNNMWLMDQEIGEKLDELEALGLAEDTIVFYYGDHGGALPRGKRNMHDSGTRVPLIIRIPEKWKHLRPAEVGGWVDQPVAFVDFASTVFSILGIEAPKNYEGVPFLGKNAAPARDHVFLFRGRMDERYDTARGIRTSEYLFIKNFSPHRPWGQWYSYPFRVMPSMWSWRKAFDAGETNAEQSRYWQEKPAEEFYVIGDDPYQVKNLIDDAAHQETIAQLRKTLSEEMLAMHDTGLVPEGMYEALSGEGTLYDYVHSDAYPAAEVLKIATAATSRDSGKVVDLLTALESEHPVIRYWGAVGLLVLGKDAGDVSVRLQELLKDPVADIQVVAAEALGRYFGEAKAVAPLLVDITYSGNPYEVMESVQVLERFARGGQLPWEDVRAMLPTAPVGEAERVWMWIRFPDDSTKHVKPKKPKKKKVAASVEVPTTEPTGIIVIAGQSNAVGYDGDAAKLPASELDKQVLFRWRTGDPPVDKFDNFGLVKGGWVTLQPQKKSDPMPKGTIDRQYGNAAYDEFFGVEMTMARTLRKAQPDQSIAVLKTAWNGTNLQSDWAVGGDCYDTWVKETRRSLASGTRDFSLRAVVWIQGESDANAANAPLYADRLTNMIERYRKTFNVPELPVLLGVNTQFGGGKKPEMAQIVAAQKTVAEADPNIVYVDTAEAPLANNAHYNSKGYMDAGVWFAEALLGMN